MTTKRTTKTSTRAKRTVTTRKLKTTKNLVGKTAVGNVNQLVAIEIRNLNSNSIRDITYSNGDLTVNFRNGGLYRYPKIDSTLVMSFLAAESYGKFFNEKMKHLPCEKLS